MDSFIITAHGTYTREEIPPRCRKPRPVTHVTQTTTIVPAVDSTQAPVAFRVHQVIPEGRVDEIRTHQGRLYGLYRPVSGQTEPTTPGSAQFPSEVDADSHDLTRLMPHGTPSSAEEFSTAVSEQLASFLIIDGAVWVTVAEPGYLVTTFGLGGLNGSTGLMVSTRRDHGTLFRADEFDAARVYAAEVARERGDRADRYEDDEQAERHRGIEVLIPEAVTLVTVPPTPRRVRDLRFEYARACDRLSQARTPDEEAELFGEVVWLRGEIIRSGHAPVRPDVQPYEARHGQQEVMWQ